VPVAYDDAPLRRFHLRVAAASTGGVFSDGFGLGIIGIALTAATPDLGLTPVWLGLLGGGSLAGLFAGALLTGPFADRFGRRPVFAANMALLAVLSALQFFVASSGELLALRLAIGFVLGTDYVVSKALLTEFTPRLLRGPIMSLLSVAWAAGYACAFLVGFLLTSGGTDAWRWMLLAGAVPCMLVLPFRLTIPESPLWLVDHGHAARAADVVAMIAGPFVRPPARGVLGADRQGRWQQLFTSTWRRRTLVGCAFFTCQVIPYFAVGTFVSRVIAAINGGGGYLGGLVYNLALLCGAILGLLTIDRMPRRTFLLLSFVLPAGAMLALVVARNLPPAAVIVLFAAFAGVLSAASNLVYVYLPELFPTDLRASGIGLAIASSRVGSAISTFLLPVLMADSGVRTALGVCVGVLVLGAIVCHVWAPETRRIRLSVVAPDAAVATRP
jgi:putative MFS transporter